jgi:hypothetical protein
VLGLARALPGEQAQLHGFRRVRAPGKSYPTLIAGGGMVSGLLVGGISPRQRERLALFEGVVEYCEAILPVRTAEGDEQPVRLFMPRRPPRSAEDWSFERWRRVDKRRYLRRFYADGYPVPAYLL